MQLKADPVNGNAATLEIFHHRVDRVGFAVQAFALCLVIKKERLWVGLVRPAKRLLDVRRTFFRQSNAGLVEPERIFDAAILVESFIHHIPSKNLAGIMLHDGCDVLL